MVSALHNEQEPLLDQPFTPTIGVSRNDKQAEIVGMKVSTVVAGPLCWKLFGGKHPFSRLRFSHRSFGDKNRPYLTISSVPFECKRKMQ
jgi:hypothetical protein